MASLGRIEQANARFMRVRERIDQEENVTAYRLAWRVPLAFYSEYDDDTCLKYLLNGEAEARSDEIVARIKRRLNTFFMGLSDVV